MIKEKYNITGMSCAACSAYIEKHVGALEGVSYCAVNLLLNTMDVEYDEAIVNNEDIVKCIRRGGYDAFLDSALIKDGSADVSNQEKSDCNQCNLVQNNVNDGDKNIVSKQVSITDYTMREALKMKKRLISSIILLIPIMYLSMGQMAGFKLPAYLHNGSHIIILCIVNALLSLSVMIINKKFFIKGLPGMIHGAFNMDSLVAVGSLASYLYSLWSSYRLIVGFNTGNNILINTYKSQLYYESAAMVLALVTLGKFLEARSKAKTTGAIEALLEMAPDTARVKYYDNVCCNAASQCSAQFNDSDNVLNKEQFHIEENVPVSRLKVGDIVIIKPGEKIPVDGVITIGVTSADESSFTGESIPVNKTVGDSVSTATLNIQGVIEVRVTRIGEDTSFARMVNYVKEAAASKAPIAKLADKIAGIFVPVVFAISIVTFIIWIIATGNFELALNFAITILVISCPCALGLATPTAIMVGSGVGAKLGIFVKNGEALEAAATVDTIVFDKTGTITNGTPRVVNVLAQSGPFGDRSVLNHFMFQNIYYLEKMSSHPLSQAVIDYFENQTSVNGDDNQNSRENANCCNNDLSNISLNDKNDMPSVTNYEELFGLGIKGDIDGITYIGGNLKLMKKYGIDIDTKSLAGIYSSGSNGDNLALSNMDTDYINDAAYTNLYFATLNGDASELVAIFSLIDDIKDTSIDAIKLLKNHGYKTVMMSGDRSEVATNIASKLGIDEVHGEVMPQDKASMITDIMASGNRTAMVGDGINDSPALTVADVGIAIGAGADIAVESADIVISGSDMRSVYTSFALAKRTMRTIKQNLFWAFFYNLLCIPVAAGALYPAFGIRLNPMFGAAAMCFSSVFVVTNALRIRNFTTAYDICDKINKDIPGKLENSSKIQNENFDDKVTLNQNLGQHTINLETLDNISSDNEESEMKKIISIEGMMCPHCEAHVTKALEELGFDSVKADHKKGKAVVKGGTDVADALIEQAVTAAGYKVTGIENKKGLF